MNHLFKLGIRDFPGFLIFFLVVVGVFTEALRLFVAVRGFSLIEACRRLVVVVSVVAEHRL